MIYLRERKLLFLKPRKTAGTSVEIALSRYAGPEDIVTPVLAEDELKRMEVGGQFPVNWTTPEKEARFREEMLRYRRGAQKTPPFFQITTSKFFNHISPKKIAERAGEDFLHDAKVVTMCRHPYEVFVSQVYFFRSFRKLEIGFSELAEILAQEIVTNLPFYFYKDQVLPARVIRYEHLNADLRAFEAEEGLRILDYLPVTKQGARDDRRPAREILSPALREICYRRNRPIFDLFGYEP